MKSVVRALTGGRRWLFWVTAAVALAADLVTKALLWQQPGPGAEPTVVIPGLLRIIPHPGNTQGALGLGPDSPYFYIVVAVIGLGAVLYILLTSPPDDATTAAGLGLLAGGALGNLYDRAVLHRVRDFIDLHVGEFHWHTFNVADAAICVGFALVLYQWVRILLRERAAERHRAARAADRAEGA